MAPQHGIDPLSVYFPPLRIALQQDPSLFRNLQLDCMICRGPMNIVGDGLPAPDARPNGYATTHGVVHATQLNALRPTHDQDMAMVLPCGHILCKGCLFMICFDDYDVADFNLYNRDAKSGPNCPACFSVLQFSSCPYRCRIPGIPFPSSPEALQMFQPTIPEGLPGLPVRCNSCLLARAQVFAQEHVDAVLSETMPFQRRALRVYTTITDEQGANDPFLIHTFQADLERRALNVRALTALRPWGGPKTDRNLRFILQWRP